MKNFLLALAVLLVMGTLAVAQTYDQSQDTPSTPSTMNSTQSNDSTMNQQSSDNTAFSEQTDLNSPDFTHPDFRGTNLDKAYQQEPQSGWQDPNITKSAETIGGGGG